MLGGKSFYSVLAVLFVSSLFINNTYAVKLMDRAKEYDIRFTNPICKEYKFDKPVRANDGSWLTAKPKNVFCTRSDKPKNFEWDHSPEKKLKAWIDGSKKGDRIFFAYYSFSSSKIARALCNAAQRGTRIEFFKDSSQDDAKADFLNSNECVGPSGKTVRKLTGGWTGQIGNAHNKVFILKKKNDPDYRISFSSGNLSSGVVVHHENWHFITVPGDTFFAQAHLCLREAIVTHAKEGTGRNQYAAQIKSCKAEARKKYKEETDIKTFFVPGEGEAATKWMLEGIRASARVYVAAHRFSHYPMVHELRRKLTKDSKSVRIVVDDDLWWAGKGEKVGPNMEYEWHDRLKPLIDRGARVSYLETNHDGFLLHHNKFLVFRTLAESGKAPAVFAGAANLTDGAFFMWKWSIKKDGPTNTPYPYGTNLENVYFITVPHVVKAFAKQFGHLYGDLGTLPPKLPRENTLPF